MMRSFLDFADLIKPIKPHAFFADHYGRAPCLIEADADLYQSLFNWDDVSQLLEMSSVWSGETLKVVLDQKTINPNEYCRSATGRDGVSLMRPQPELINKWMARGASVVLDNVEHMHPGLRSIGEAVSFATNSMVNANVYCSYEGHQAFRSHFDTTDVFVFQFFGTKKWNVYDGRFQEPIEADGFYFPSFDDAHHKRAKGKARMTPVLAPGHFLYLPKGQYHDACAMDGPSLHVTFATTQARGVDFLRTIINSLVEVPAFRAALPDFDDVDAHGAHIRELADSLRDILVQPEIAEQMRDDQRRRAFQDLARFDVPSKPGVSVYRVRHVTSSLALGGNGYVLSAGGKSIQVPGEATAAVEWIIERTAFAMADLEAVAPDMDADMRNSMLQALCEAGVLDKLER